MSKTKRDAPKRPRTSADTAQLGIFAIPDMNLDDNVEDDDDDDLEAELNMILSGGAKPKPPPRTVKAPQVNLDKMVADSLRDIPSDESSGDENEEDLLAELQMVTGEQPEIEVVNTVAPTFQNVDYINIINERLQMYKEAEANATATGDVTKGRRLARGLKTLSDLLKKANSGGVINEEDIPPPVSSGVKKMTEVTETSDVIKPIDIDTPLIDFSMEPVKKPENDESEIEKAKILSVLTQRRDEYKTAAVMSKRNGDVQTAISFVKVAKQFDTVISAAEKGEPVDLSNMPPPPTVPNKAEPEKQESLENPEKPIIPKVEPKNVEPPKNPETVMEALEQRLEKFKEQEEAGKQEGNSGKVRRMGRIIKQYQDAIKLHKAGKPIPVDELPTPPGFAPIPVEGAPAQDTPQIAPVPPTPTPVTKQPTIEPNPGPSKPKTDVSPTGKETRQEKQLKLLQVKQKQFKEAALNAKKTGDMALAKEYLRQSKCFDNLITATLSGIPVDFSSLPPPPGSQQAIEKEYEIVKLDDCIPGTVSEIYNQLIHDLQKQLKMCMETRAHFKAIGDVASANRFEQLAVNTKKDLDTVKISCNKDQPVPKFHYEMKKFSIVRCNTDLNDNDLELTIVQGINYNVINPKEIDTYVRYEFPYPTDDPKKDKTSTIYNTNNPVYDAVYIIPIQRTNRACQRIFKRHAIKLEIWSKGGFLRSDTLIGTVAIKLLPLETKCTIHDSFDLMNGKKAIGGKLEVKIKIRNPIQTRQLEQLQEKWLIID